MKRSTPGPWHRNELLVECEDHPYAKTGRYVCNVVGGGLPVSEQEANAELIAAAPTLLELLQRFVNHFPGDDGLDEACQCGGLDALLVEARSVVADVIQPTGDRCPECPENGCGNSRPCSDPAPSQL